MRVITIGSDRKLFEEESTIRARARMQAALFESHTIVVFSRRSHDLREEYIEPHVKIVPTNSFSRLLYGFDAIRIGLKEKNATLVSVQDPFETGLAGLVLARALRIPLQIQIHTDFLSPFFVRYSLSNLVRTYLAKFVIPRADCIRAVSQRIVSSLRAIAPHLRTSVVPVFTVSQSEGGVAVPGFKQFFLITSRLESEKDIPLALRAFARVSATCPGLGLVIAGDGGERKKLEALVKRLRIESAVAFVGWRKDLTFLRQHAIAFLNTSRYEGYGLSLMESARDACPIVTTDVGIVGEIIREDDAYVVPVGDQRALEAALHEVLGDIEGAKRKAQRLRSRIGPLPTHEEYLSALTAAFSLCQKSKR